MSGDTSLYSRLGIPQAASPEEIRSAYREAARRLHPDVNVQTGATELFLNVKEAYEILIDPDQRAIYDGKIAHDPKPPIPVRIKTSYSRSAITRLREKQLLYTLIDLEVLANLIDHQKDISPARNLALLLDCSTSMQGERLDVVKAAAIGLVRQLRPKDILSIISFNDRAEVILPSASHLETMMVESRIRMLQSSGGTELFNGLNAGFKEVRRFLDPSYTNHIVLITDGHTYGDEAKCLALADQAAKLGISISGLGIGSEWNDEFLDELTRRTGGKSIYIRKSKEIRDCLQLLFDRLGDACIERVNFDFRTIPGVTLGYAFRIKPDAAVLPVTPPLLFGNIPRNESQQVILEFLIDPIAPTARQIMLAEGRITFDIPGYTKATYRVPLTLLRDVTDQTIAEPAPPEILQAMSRLTLYRLQEKARLAVAAGEVDAAARTLQHLATHLLSKGENELAKLVITETQHLQHQHRFSQNGEKQIKYGTRSLLLPPGPK